MSEIQITDLGDSVRAYFKEKLDSELNDIGREDPSFEDGIHRVEFLISGDFSAEVRIFFYGYHPIEVTSSRKNRTVGESASAIAWHLVKGLSLRHAWKKKKEYWAEQQKINAQIKKSTTPGGATSFSEAVEDVLWVGDDKEDV